MTQKHWCVRAAREREEGVKTLRYAVLKGCRDIVRPPTPVQITPELLTVTVFYSCSGPAKNSAVMTVMTSAPRLASHYCGEAVMRLSSQPYVIPKLYFSKDKTLCLNVSAHSLFSTVICWRTPSSSCKVMPGDHKSGDTGKQINRSHTQRAYLSTALCQLRVCRMFLLLWAVDLSARRSARRYRCILVKAKVTVLWELASCTAWTQSCNPDLKLLIFKTTTWDSDSTSSPWNLQRKKWGLRRWSEKTLSHSELQNSESKCF